MKEQRYRDGVETERNKVCQTFCRFIENICIQNDHLTYQLGHQKNCPVSAKRNMKGRTPDVRERRHRQSFVVHCPLTERWNSIHAELRVVRRMTNTSEIPGMTKSKNCCGVKLMVGHMRRKQWTLQPETARIHRRTLLP